MAQDRTTAIHYWTQHGAGADGHFTTSLRLPEHLRDEIEQHKARHGLRSFNSAVIHLLKEGLAHDRAGAVCPHEEMLQEIHTMTSRLVGDVRRVPSGMFTLDEAEPWPD